MKDEELVARFYDGDLDEAQSKQAQELLAADAGARSRLERLALIGSLVREAESERALPADFTDRVMAGVLATEKQQRPRRLLPATGLALASALALAAAVALWLRGQSDPRDDAGAPLVSLAAPAKISPSAAVREAFEQDALAEAMPVSIESVDFGATQGAIFLVSAGVTDTMVVWTMDEPAPSPAGSKR